MWAHVRKNINGMSHVDMFSEKYGEWRNVEGNGESLRVGEEMFCDSFDKLRRKGGRKGWKLLVVRQVGSKQCGKECPGK